MNYKSKKYNQHKQVEKITHLSYYLNNIDLLRNCYYSLGELLTLLYTMEL